MSRSRHSRGTRSCVCTRVLSLAWLLLVLHRVPSRAAGSSEPFNLDEGAEEIKRVGGQLELGEATSFDVQAQENRAEESTLREMLSIAQQRFSLRTGDSGPTSILTDPAFSTIQLLRVPKAGSSTMSAIARHLVGCQPPGPCCKRRMSQPPGTCPAEDLLCPKVIGCAGHNVDAQAMANPGIFKLSHMRSPVDRIVSGFLYGGVHAPRCAHQNAPDTAMCFKAMANSITYQNIAAKMFSALPAYSPGTRVCWDEDPTCHVNLATAMRGICKLHFVAITEAMGTSMLLLLENLPWVEPVAHLFPGIDETGYGGPAGTPEADPPIRPAALRYNTSPRHNQGMELITHDLREVARSLNAVDLALYDFAVAKFCQRLEETGLIAYPSVEAELNGSEAGRRCFDRPWYTRVIVQHADMAEECKLFNPLEQPM